MSFLNLALKNNQNLKSTDYFSSFSQKSKSLEYKEVD